MQSEIYEHKTISEENTRINSKPTREMTSPWARRIW